ncbi:pyridoxamine 5'-phosphate oxidase family protein [Nocardioides sp. DS6]|uniref:Pyridoxamine 5'-phosphate oxidase family protein n=1 Tax=Nocardioides eburneus TaxID=3231482 RepID=A0ABV3SZQ5_9ACTN
MAHLEELTVEESWKLAATSRLSRIGWNGPTGPVVIPVNHVISDGAVWIRTGAHSAMAEQVDESAIALLIDDLDPDTHLGWSVQFKGRAEICYHEDQVPEHVRTQRTWPGGARPLWVRLTPADVNGRRLTAD